MDSTWEKRDLVVLDAAVRYLDQHDDSFPQGFDLAEITKLPQEDVNRALRALEDEFLKLEKTYGDAANWCVSKVYPSARFAVGQWPSPDAVADRLTAALGQAADSAADEEERGLLKRTATWFGGAGRDVLVEVAAAVVSRGVGAG